MNLYIARHGRTQWNSENRLQGWKNSELTEFGRANARRLAERLEEVNFDLIYSSNQKRAVDTAEIIRGERKSPIIQLDELKEIGFGSWEGMPKEELLGKYAKEFDIYLNKPHLYQPRDGESYQDVFERVERGLNQIMSNGGENLLLISHGVTIKVIMAIIKGIELKDLNTIPVFPSTSLSICRLEEGKLQVLLEGDDSHLEPYQSRF